jgi:large subunit ribosomal protein L21
MVELDRVLLIADGDSVTIGSPIIDGAKVTATYLGEKKGVKVIIFKYKNKTRYARKRGHRQLCTRLEIKDILKPNVAAGGKV